jgi:KICSTOR complex protein SZT2
VQVLQNRLNDAVLEVLCGMLGRNPMCKLTPDDVHFIQRPGEPADIKLEVRNATSKTGHISQPLFCFLQFAIQPFAVDNLQALVVYLRQNLMEFLHTPKYTDSKAENHFQVCF